jgi:hypothetical protein
MTGGQTGRWTDTWLDIARIDTKRCTIAVSCFHIFKADGQTDGRTDIWASHGQYCSEKMCKYCELFPTYTFSILRPPKDWFTVI